MLILIQKTLMAQLVLVEIAILLREDVGPKLIPGVSIFWTSSIKQGHHERLLGFRTQALWGLLVKWLAEVTVDCSTAHATSVMQVANLWELLSHTKLAKQVKTVLLMLGHLFLQLNLWAIHYNFLLAFLFLSYFTTWSTTHHIDLLLEL